MSEPASSPVQTVSTARQTVQTTSTPRQISATPSPRPEPVTPIQGSHVQPPRHPSWDSPPPPPPVFAPPPQPIPSFERLAANPLFGALQQTLQADCQCSAVPFSLLQVLPQQQPPVPVSVRAGLVQLGFLSLEASFPFEVEQVRNFFYI